MSQWQTIATRLRTDVLEPIKATLVGKNEIVEVLGVALVAGENAFLLGPPGTAKSALIGEFARRLSGKSFDYLLTRFTEPSELFGPFDLRKLRDGDLVTNTEGMLPEADFVFLDELLNANSAILNSLLLALNEKMFRRGREKASLPMLMAVGASNHLPEDDALGALFDRFMLRIECNNVPDSELNQVLIAGWKREKQLPPEVVMSVNDIRILQEAALTVDMESVREAFVGLVERLRTSGITISDRRAVRLQRILAASSILCGRSQANVSDLWTLRYIWESPSQVEILQSHIEAVREKYNEEDRTTTTDHPLADLNAAPKPDLLLAEIESVMSSPGDESNSDKLALIAARVEWVNEETTRQHLREKINEVRQSLDLAN